MRNGTGLGWMLLALLTGGCGMGKPTKGAPGNALPSAPAKEAPPAVAGEVVPQRRAARAAR